MHKEPSFPVEGPLGRRARGDRFSKVSVYILGEFISLRKGTVNSFKENVLKKMFKENVFLIRPIIGGLENRQPVANRYLDRNPKGSRFSAEGLKAA